MARSKYRARQASIAWFNVILYISGAILNVFAVASVVNWAVRSDASPSRTARARVELEDPLMCTKHMAGRKFTRGKDEEFSLLLHDGKDIKLSYRSQSTYGQTKEGHRLEMVAIRYGEEATATGLLFFMVNGTDGIEGCLSPYTYPMNRSRKLECLAAAGEFLINGDCRLPVNQPSDCAMMNGTLSGKSCLVPSGNQILRAAAPSSEDRTCMKPDCETH